MREWEAAESVDWQTLEHEARAAGSATTTIDLEDPRFLARGGMEARLRSYYQEKQRGVPATRGALVRAILESIAASYRRTLDEVERVLI